MGSNQVSHNRIYLPLSHKATVGEMSTLWPMEASKHSRPNTTFNLQTHDKINTKLPKLIIQWLLRTCSLNYAPQYRVIFKIVLIRCLKNKHYSVGNPDVWYDLQDITLRKSDIVQIHCDETLIQALPHSCKYTSIVSQYLKVSESMFPYCKELFSIKFSRMSFELSHFERRLDQFCFSVSQNHKISTNYEKIFKLI